jgi:hypothetical protein
MGVLQRLRHLFQHKELQDPVFGMISFEKSAFWVGDILFEPLDKQIQVLIWADESGPTDRDRQAFLELQTRYVELQSSVASTLFKEYENYPSEIDEPFVPQISSPTEIWQHTSLDTIDIGEDDASSMSVFGLSYSFDWDSEHSFDVEVKDWDVVGLAVSG